MGAATRRIQVGTWIANIYLRHSYVCAQGAALIADATDGRFVLGLGVSHPPVNKALGIDMADPPAMLRRYVVAVRSWLKGEGPATHLPQRSAPRPVPIYMAAVTSRTVELAGELADGIMPFLWSAERVKKSKTWIGRGRAKASGLGKVDVNRILGRPFSLCSDRRPATACASCTAAKCSAESQGDGRSTRLLPLTILYAAESFRRQRPEHRPNALAPEDPTCTRCSPC